jgi:hypothetical protein
LHDGGSGHGNAVTGFRLDYGCPTGKLRGYARFLAGLRRELGRERVAPSLKGFARRMICRRLLAKCLKEKRYGDFNALFASFPQADREY